MASTQPFQLQAPSLWIIPLPHDPTRGGGGHTISFDQILAFLIIFFFIALIRAFSGAVQVSALSGRDVSK